MGLFYSKKTTNSGLVGYADAEYLSDLHKARSQIDYLFCYNNTAISWRSTKQTLVTTSSNHSEIISLYEAGRECVWLKSIIAHIQKTCGLKPVIDSPTIIYEDNAACVAQVRGGYIKGDRTKHISPNFFILMSFKNVDKLMSNKFAPLIILQIYLLNLCRLQYLRNLFMALECGELTRYKINFPEEKIF